jgi:hypothetical protein
MMLRSIAALVLLGLASAPTRADDWPQLAHDPARSGATADQLKPPFSRKWYRLFADEGIQAGVEPVVVRGRLNIGTLRGIVHAIDAETGHDVWSYRAGGPILHACEAGHQRVFFTCADGKIYCLDAGNGALKWTITTGAPLWNAPALDGENLIVGGRDGELYAIHPTKGEIRWTAPVGGAILSSPAIDEKLARVYVGCEDMHVYAFDLATGKQLWKSEKLPGVSFRGYHPVIAPDGLVMITVTPCAGGDAIQQVLLDMAKSVFGQFSSWRIKSEDEKKRIRTENFELMKDPQTYKKQLDYLRDRLTREPALQTFFVLDPKTGKSKFVAPIVYAESMNGPAMPPVVTPDGKVIVKYNALLRSRYEHYSPFLNVGYLDTATGHITPIMDQSRTYGWYDSLLLVHDEQSQLSVAGTSLINAHQDNVNAMDLNTLEGFKQPWATGVHEVKSRVAARLWATLLHNKPLPMGWEWLPRGTAVYGGGSAIDVPVVISGDSFYFLPSHEINAGVALIGYKTDRNGNGGQRAPEPTENLTADDAAKIRAQNWDWDTLEMPRLNLTLAGLPEKIPGTRLNPLNDEAKAKVAKITDAELDSLIEETIEKPAVAKTAKPDERLEKAVDELISTQWRPLLFPAAKAPSEAYRLFTEPTETLYTLSLAYPHLSPTLQTKVQAHVNAMLAAGGMLEGPVGRKTYDLSAGDIRSAYDEAPANLLKMANDVVRSDTARIYPFYLWARVSGDWDPIKSRWPSMKNLIDPTAPPKEPDLGNGRISGLIAACRIAKQLNDDQALATLLPQTRTAIRKRLQYEFAHTQGGVITTAGNRSLFGRWRNLSPEMASILANFATPVHEHLIDVYVDHHRPAWFVAWNVELLWRNESPFSFPSMSNEIFAAKALILRESADRLASFIDLPWCKADEFYIQKLALLSSSR